MAQPPQQQKDPLLVMVRPVEAGADWQEYRREEGEQNVPFQCAGPRIVMKARHERQQEEGGS